MLTHQDSCSSIMCMATFGIGGEPNEYFLYYNYVTYGIYINTSCKSLLSLIASVL